MRRILLDELAQARDLHVDRAVEDFVLAPARELHQLVARQRRPRVRDQDLEQGELARGERDRLAVALSGSTAGAPGGGGAARRRSTALMRATSSRGLNGLGR